MRASYVSPSSSIWAIPALLLGLAMPGMAQVNVNLDALNPPAAGQAAPQTSRPARPAARPATRPKPPATGTAARRPGGTTPPATQTAPTQAAPANAAAPVGGSTAGSTANGPTVGTTSGTTVGATARTTPGGAPGTAAGAAAGAAVGGAAAVGAAALALPAAAPATPVIAPATAPVPVVAAPPVQRPATSATAGSATAATTEGLRVTFAGGKSDLTPESATTLTDFAKKLPGGETVSLNVVAFATGTPEDPSTARRLSLARALAIRSALMADGVASTRIYVRAMGAPAGTDAGPADRVDISVLGAPNTQAGVSTNPAAGTARP